MHAVFDLSPDIAGIESSTVYFVSVPANLLIGWAVDRIGHRAHLLLAAVLLMVPVDLVIGLQSLMSPSNVYFFTPRHRRPLLF